MGTGYTRNDTSNNIADGNVIDAADLDGEFDSIQAAFNNTTGHTHDGTSAEGAPITVTGPAQEYVSTGTELRAKTNNTYDLGSAAVQWKNAYLAGNVTVGGTVDGRDVAADGTKLDGIEASADVTDTANVTAAGALMDSELTNITAVKALNQGVSTTDSPTFAALTTTGNISPGGTVDGRDVAADGTKLDGIEANADVTDTANVTAAGALMDSEVTNLAAVKAFDPTDYATAAQGVLADSATQPGDNISTLTNDAGYTTNVGDITGVTAGTGLSGGGTSGSVTLDVDLNELPTSTTNGDGDYFVVVDTLGAERKLTKGNIAISGFNNDAGYTTNVGDITGVTAGGGITGGGTSGTVTVSHANTSSQGSVNNSGATVIQDVTLDGYGHVTSLGSATITTTTIGAATSAQGALANSAVQPGDNISTLTNNSGYLTGITGQSIKNLSDVYSSMSPTNGQVLTYNTTNGWRAEDAGGGYTLTTPVSASEGLTLTGIPSGVTSVRVLLNNIRMQANSNPFLLQLGDSGGIETSGYDAADSSVSQLYDGFPTAGGSATYYFSGFMELQKMGTSGHTWLGTWIVYSTINSVFHGAGIKTLSGELTQVKIQQRSTGSIIGGTIGLAYM